MFTLYSGKVAFLITKPLQLMVALSIINKHEWGEKPNLIIIDLFFESRLIADNLSHVFFETRSAIHFPSKDAAAKFIKAESIDILFVDSDVGVLNFLYLARIKIKTPTLLIYVYEEGLGTYQNDFYPWYKKFIYKILGIGSYFGGCALTTGIYVFSKTEYERIFPHNKHKVIHIEIPLLEFMSNNRIELSRIFDFAGVANPKKDTSTCYLYLSSLHIDYEFISHLRKKSVDVYIKPHPHIKEPMHSEGFLIVNANVPAELLILDLLDKYCHIVIFDHFSSVRYYVADSRVTFKQITDATNEL